MQMRPLAASPATKLFIDRGEIRSNTTRWKIAFGINSAAMPRLACISRQSVLGSPVPRFA